MKKVYAIVFEKAEVKFKDVCEGCVYSLDSDHFPEIVSKHETSDKALEELKKYHTRFEAYSNLSSIGKILVEEYRVEELLLKSDEEEKDDEQILPGCGNVWEFSDPGESDFEPNAIAGRHLIRCLSNSFSPSWKLSDIFDGMDK